MAGESPMEGGHGPRRVYYHPGTAREHSPVRERLPQDFFGIFQLYSSATPQPVRAGLGFTLEQWNDAQEPGDSRQWVAVQQDRITGWAGLWRRSGINRGQVLMHPVRPEIAEPLLDAALSQPGQHVWPVPEHQEGVRLRLLRRGFREGPETAVLVKNLAARKFSYVAAGVEALG